MDTLDSSEMKAADSRTNGNTMTRLMINLDLAELVKANNCCQRKVAGVIFQTKLFISSACSVDMIQILDGWNYFQSC